MFTKQSLLKLGLPIGRELRYYNKQMGFYSLGFRQGHFFFDIELIILYLQRLLIVYKKIIRLHLLVRWVFSVIPTPHSRNIPIHAFLSDHSWVMRYVKRGQLTNLRSLRYRKPTTMREYFHENYRSYYIPDVFFLFNNSYFSSLTTALLNNYSIFLSFNDSCTYVDGVTYIIPTNSDSLQISYFYSQFFYLFSQKEKNMFGKLRFMDRDVIHYGLMMERLRRIQMTLKIGDLSRYILKYLHNQITAPYNAFFFVHSQRPTKSLNFLRLLVSKKKNKKKIHRYPPQPDPILYSRRHAYRPKGLFPTDFSLAYAGADAYFSKYFYSGTSQNNLSYYYTYLGFGYALYELRHLFMFRFRFLNRNLVQKALYKNFHTSFLSKFGFQSAAQYQKNLFKFGLGNQEKVGSALSSKVFKSFRKVSLFTIMRKNVKLFQRNLANFRLFQESKQKRSLDVKIKNTNIKISSICIGRSRVILGHRSLPLERRPFFRSIFRMQMRRNFISQPHLVYYGEILFRYYLRVKKRLHFTFSPRQWRKLFFSCFFPFLVLVEKGRPFANTLSNQNIRRSDFLPSIRLLLRSSAKNRSILFQGAAIINYRTTNVLFSDPIMLPIFYQSNFSIQHFFLTSRYRQLFLQNILSSKFPYQIGRGGKKKLFKQSLLLRRRWGFRMRKMRRKCLRLLKFLLRCLRLQFLPAGKTAVFIMSFQKQCLHQIQNFFIRFLFLTQHTTWGKFYSKKFLLVKNKKKTLRVKKIKFSALQIEQYMKPWFRRRDGSERRLRYKPLRSLNNHRDLITNHTIANYRRKTFKVPRAEFDYMTSLFSSIIQVIDVGALPYKRPFFKRPWRQSPFQKKKQELIEKKKREELKVQQRKNKKKIRRIQQRKKIKKHIRLDPILRKIKIVNLKIKYLVRKFYKKQKYWINLLKIVRSITKVRGLQKQGKLLGFIKIIILRNQKKLQKLQRIGVIICRAYYRHLASILKDLKQQRRRRRWRRHAAGVYRLYKKLGAQKRSSLRLSGLLKPLTFTTLIKNWEKQKDNLNKLKVTVVKKTVRGKTIVSKVQNLNKKTKLLFKKRLKLFKKLTFLRFQKKLRQYYKNAKHSIRDELRHNVRVAEIQNKKKKKKQAKNLKRQNRIKASQLRHPFINTFILNEQNQKPSSKIIKNYPSPYYLAFRKMIGGPVDIPAHLSKIVNEHTASMEKQLEKQFGESHRSFVRSREKRNKQLKQAKQQPVSDKPLSPLRRSYNARVKRSYRGRRARRREYKDKLSQIFVLTPCSLYSRRSKYFHFYPSNLRFFLTDRRLRYDSLVCSPGLYRKIYISFKSPFVSSPRVFQTVSHLQRYPLSVNLLSPYVSRFINLLHPELLPFYNKLIREYPYLENEIVPVFLWLVQKNFVTHRNKTDFLFFRYRYITTGFIHRFLFSPLFFFMVRLLNCSWCGTLHQFVDSCVIRANDVIQVIHNSYSNKYSLRQIPIKIPYIEVVYYPAVLENYQHYSQSTFNYPVAFRQCGVRLPRRRCVISLQKRDRKEGTRKVDYIGL